MIEQLHEDKKAMYKKYRQQKDKNWWRNFTSIFQQKKTEKYLVKNQQK